MSLVNFTDEQVMALDAAEIETLSLDELALINHNGQISLLSEEQLDAMNKRLEVLHARFRFSNWGLAVEV